MLLNVPLPGISGLEFLSIVRENYSLVGIIMVSALSEVDGRRGGDDTRRLSLHHQKLRLRQPTLAR